MKVPLLNGENIDTDELKDKDAALVECINNFYLTCKKFNVTGFAKVVIEDDRGLSMLHVPNENDEIKAEEYSKLISSLAAWITKTSNGRLIVVDTWEHGESQETGSISD